MITRLIHLTVGLGVASAAWATDNAPEVKPDEVKTAGYHLKNQSSFQVAPGVRAPFWPIGWAPSGKSTTQNDAPAPTPVITPEQFALTSIMLGTPSLAIINGVSFKQGDYYRQARAVKGAPGTATPPPASAVAPLPPGLRVQVVRIMDGQVVLQSGAQAIVVPLRRPQLSDRKPGDEDLLSLSDR